MIDIPNVLNSFSKTEFNEWQQSIEKELKDKKWTDLSWKVNERIQVDAAYAADPAKVNAKLHRQNRNHWEIAEMFYPQNQWYPSAIADALNHGVEAPFIIGHENQKISEYTFQNIIPEFIECMCFGYSMDQFSNFISILKAKIKSDTPINGGFLPPINSGSELENISNELLNRSAELSSDFKLFHICPQLESSDETCDSILAEILAGVQCLIDTNNVGIMNRILVSIPVGDHMLIEIGKIRALHILLRNLWLHNEGSQQAISGISIHSFNDLSTYQADENTNRIKAAIQAWAMINGGSDYITTIPGHLNPDQSEILFNRRIARNIHHIYRYESFLDQVSDPLNGSYLIEEITRQIATSSWEIFKKESLPKYRESQIPLSKSFDSQTFGNY
jgi:methylmalonyl-CoA mutase